MAEEVEKVNPDLVVRDKEGKPYSVRYDAGERDVAQRVPQRAPQSSRNNEATITELKSTVAQQQKDFQATAAHQQKQINRLGLQKVSAQLEASKPAPQVVNNP